MQRVMQSFDVAQIIEEGVSNLTVFFPKRDMIGEIISATIKKDPISKPVDALLEIYRKMRPGDPPTVPTAYRLLEGMFFDARRFDLFLRERNEREAEERADHG